MTQTPPPPPLPGQDPQQQQGYQSYGQQSYQQQSYGQPAYGQEHGLRGGTTTPEEQSMMLISHLSGPVANLVSAGFLPFLGPLVVWFLYKDRSHAVREVSAGAFNFNLMVAIAQWACWAFIFITLGVGALVAWVPMLIIWVLSIWAPIRGTLKTMNGEVYRYPFQLPVLH